MAKLQAKRVETVENPLNQAQNMMQVIRLCQVILHFYSIFFQLQLMFKIQIKLIF